MNSQVKQVMTYTGATQEEAEKAVKQYPDSIIDAIASLTVVPPISGTKHIPPPPKVDDGHDDETRERIRQGRILADILTFAPQNDLRGKASHYPAKAEQTAAEECKHPPAVQLPPLSSQ